MRTRFGLRLPFVIVAMGCRSMPVDVGGAPPPVASDGRAMPTLLAVRPTSREEFGKTRYPIDAADRNIDDGTARIQFTVDGYRIRDIHALEASDTAFARAAIDAVATFKCHAAEPTTLTIPFVYSRH